MASAKWPAGAPDIFSSTTDQRLPLGARCEDIFGRTFRYCVTGAAIAAGDAVQSAAQLTTSQDLVVIAGAVGDKQITATHGAAIAAENLFAGGMAIVDTTPGVGMSYPIKSHEAIASGGTATLVLADGWAVQVLLSTTSRLSLYHNPFKNVIQMPVTTLTAPIAGVAIFALGSGEFGWLGYNGLFGTQVDSGTAAAVGTAVGGPSTAAGALTGISGVLQHVGVMADTLADGKWQGVHWHL